MKENILRKIKQLKIGETNRFKLQCGEQIIEFRLFEINKIVFLAVSGGGISLSTYFINNITKYEDIIDDVEIHVFKGIDLTINDCRFINP
jgi:hypothetical protein